MSEGIEPCKGHRGNQEDDGGEKGLIFLLSLNLTKNPPFGGIFYLMSQGMRSLNELRTAACYRFAFCHDAEATSDFRIGFDKAAHIAAETVFVELVI